MLKRKETKAYLAEVAFSIGVWKREPNRVRVLGTDKATGVLLESPPIEILMPEDAHRYISEALAIPASEYAPRVERPPMSKQVKFMGAIAS